MHRQISGKKKMNRKILSVLNSKYEDIAEMTPKLLAA